MPIKSTTPPSSVGTVTAPPTLKVTYGPAMAPPCFDLEIPYRLAQPFADAIQTLGPCIFFPGNTTANSSPP